MYVVGQAEWCKERYMVGGWGGARGDWRLFQNDMVYGVVGEILRGDMVSEGGKGICGWVAWEGA